MDTPLVVKLWEYYETKQTYIHLLTHRHGEIRQQPAIYTIRYLDEKLPFFRFCYTSFL